VLTKIVTHLMSRLDELPLRAYQQPAADTAAAYTAAA
jgi:hypothetical protein